MFLFSKKDMLNHLAILFCLFDMVLCCPRGTTTTTTTTTKRTTPTSPQPFTNPALMHGDVLNTYYHNAVYPDCPSYFTRCLETQINYYHLKIYTHLRVYLPADSGHWDDISITKNETYEFKKTFLTIFKVSLS